MVIQSRTIVGAAAAFAVVGATLWGSAMLLEPSAQKQQHVTSSVEIVQVPERAWAVEIKDLGAVEAPDTAIRTAANR